ncbi:hypothetical protein [Hyunsoonleella rubra]|uniref:Antibiotic biosynthesis monooxygenase n=1 Tax=Hyunsoonleella rubra TaxID=1737062 RepID=A0ABW5TA05_9FLAO
MKTTNQFYAVLFVLLMAPATFFAQDEKEAPRPQYMTMTTMHWNMDMEDFDMDEWKSVEKEYLDKVTVKNEHVAASSFYLHQLTPDNRELVYVRVYNTWADIEKAQKRNGELEEEGWPDEDARNAYMKKRNTYYSSYHTDEIFATLPLVKLVQDASKDMICYVRTSHLAFPDDGDDDEIKKVMTDDFNKMIKDNPLIKGYYPHRHAWGSDGREIMEAYFLDSMTDLDAVFKGLGDALEKAYPDEADRKKRDEVLRKYFTGVHGDAIYKFVAGLSK